jgi:hypothetical protein
MLLLLQDRIVLLLVVRGHCRQAVMKVLAFCNCSRLELSVSFASPQKVGVHWSIVVVGAVLAALFVVVRLLSEQQNFHSQQFVLEQMEKRSS